MEQEANQEYLDIHGASIIKYVSLNLIHFSAGNNPQALFLV